MENNVTYSIVEEGKTIFDNLSYGDARGIARSYEEDDDVSAVATVKDWDAVEDVHQTLMDIAYLNYKPNLLDTLEKDSERYAVALGNLNYQVHNGGWAQWVDNGYCVAFPHVREALEAIGGEHAKTIGEMLDTMEEFLLDEVVDGTCTDTGCMGTYLNERYTEEECPDCMGSGWQETEEEEWDDEVDEYVTVTHEEDCYYCGGEGTIECEAEYPSSEKYWELAPEWLKEVESYLKALVKEGK